LTVLAYLPTRLLQHLRFILGNENAPLVARTWGEIDQLLQANPVSVAVIDPSEAPSGKATELEQLMVAYPSLPIIAYVPLTPLAFQTVTQLAQTGMRHVVLYSNDDYAARFLPLIDQVQTSPLTTKLITALRPKLVMLPLRLAKTVENMFAEPHRYPNAQDIATISTIPLVRVHRAFREAGLATPKKVFIAAKMLKAFSYLGDPAHSVYSVSRKLGYRHTRILSDHSNDLFGMNPSRLHVYLTADQVVDRILSWSSITPASMSASTFTLKEKEIVAL
jgi:AraC-like DNA-binding protein